MLNERKQVWQGEVGMGEIVRDALFFILYYPVITGQGSRYILDIRAQGRP
jgi:hypothetical protein